MENELNSQGSKKTKSLGRGLSSLIPGIAEEVPVKPQTNIGIEKSDAQRIPGVAFILINQIRTNPYQPRREFRQEELEELSNSIKEHGVIQPVVVRRAANSTYQLIAGERRWRAAKFAGLELIPAIVRKASDRDSMELAIIENVQRSDLNCVEEALAYFQLIEEFGISQDEVAKRVGKERSTVANLLRLLKLPDQVLQDLKSDKITLGHAKVLLGIQNYESLIQVHRRTIEEGLSVRELEELVKNLENSPAKTSEESGVKTSSEPLSHAEKDLVERTFLGVLGAQGKVKLKAKSAKKIKVELTFSSVQHLNDVLGRIEKAK